MIRESEINLLSLSQNEERERTRKKERIKGRKEGRKGGSQSMIFQQRKSTFYSFRMHSFRMDTGELNLSFNFFMPFISILKTPEDIEQVQRLP